MYLKDYILELQIQLIVLDLLWHVVRMSYIYYVYEHLTQLWMSIWQHIHTIPPQTYPQIWESWLKSYKQLWMGIWQHTHTVTTTDVSPDLGEFAEIIDDVSVEMIPIRYR